MPALQVIGCGRPVGPDGRRPRGLTTRPFAADDLQLLCVLMSAYRVVQIACIVPFWIRVFLFRLHGRNFNGPTGHPSWCVDDAAPTLTAFSDAYVPIFDFEEAPKDMLVPFTLYLVVSLVYTALDVALIMGLWSAASVGTPVEPRGRDKALRALLWIKITFMNCLLVGVLGSGIYFIAEGRRTNYGCGDIGENDVISRFESSPWYTMFCVVLITYAFELLLWPCMVLNQAGGAIASQTGKSQLYGRIFNRGGEHQTTAACLWGCVKCLQCCSCNRMGGGKIRAQSDLKDAAVALMEFFNSEEAEAASFDIVLTDVWLAFKLLGRVRRERTHKLSEQAKRDRKGKDEEALVVATNEKATGDESEHSGIAMRWNQSNFFADEDEFLLQCARPSSFGSAKVTHNEDNENELGLTRKKMLRRHRPSDMHHIRQAALYANYALGPYDIYPDLLYAEGLLDGGRSGLYLPSLDLGESDNNESVCAFSLSSCFRLTDLGHPNTAVVYGSFETDILATPYCILVDEDERTVVVTIRGTATLEDMVTDLQFSSSEMNRVGEICGFNGKGKWAHRGMLAKCKWIYNDLTRRKILARLLPADTDSAANIPDGSFNLMFTGHSLGATVAAILSVMFKPAYPHLKCYAYCPPGCSVSMNVALECSDYVTSIVVGNDIIPRIRGSNFEMLRYEFLEILARVKVPKIQCWRELRTPCNNRDLDYRNKRLLYPKDKIPSSAYHSALMSFQEKRKIVFDELSPAESRLNIPGRIIHLVHAMDQKGNERKRYLPYWESRKALREISLSVEIMGQHSMDKLVLHLEKILAEYENASEGISDDEDSSVGSQEDPADFDDRYSEVNFSADDRWFILCSRPMGSVTLIPTLFSLAAVCCSAIGNNVCTLFVREVVNGELYVTSPLTNDTVSNVAGISLGLYAYGAEYYDPGEDDYVLQCSPTLPEGLENDAYVKTARAFAALALIVGILALCFLSLANCVMFGRRMFRRIAVALGLTTLFQGLVFVYLRSDVCHQDLDPLPMPLTGIELEPCRLDSGSKISLAAAVMYFVAAVSSCYLDRASLVEERLKLLTMHVMARADNKHS